MDAMQRMQAKLLASAGWSIHKTNFGFNVFFGKQRVYPETLAEAWASYNMRFTAKIYED